MLFTYLFGGFARGKPSTLSDEELQFIFQKMQMFLKEHGDSWQTNRGFGDRRDRSCNIKLGIPYALKYNQ
jgi:predicted nucleotidyltransferase